MNNEDRKIVVDIWKTIVDVQQHFNDISMRIRGLFVTTLLATFAAIGFLLNKELNLEIGDYDVQFATFVPLLGVIITFLFYIIDRYWYHLLLIGSVKHAESIEKEYKTRIPGLSLSKTIRKESPYEPGCFIRFCAKFLCVGDDQTWRNGKLHSAEKIDFFYRSVMAMLVIIAVVVGSTGGVTPRPAPTDQISAAPTSATAANPSNQAEQLESPFYGKVDNNAIKFRIKLESSRGIKNKVIDGLAQAPFGAAVPMM